MMSVLHKKCCGCVCNVCDNNIYIIIHPYQVKRTTFFFLFPQLYKLLQFQQVRSEESRNLTKI